MSKKRYSSPGGLLILVFLTLLPLLSSQAQTIRYVKTSPSGSGDGTSWANATDNLQSAINSLTATGGQVWVASGVYKPTTTTGPDSQTISFEMKSKVGIYGGFMGSENTLSERPASRPSSTTLSGNLGVEPVDIDNSYHVLTSFDVDSTALLDGFVITAGKADPGFEYNGGGGMHAERSGFQINNCLFVANQGGAISSEAASMSSFGKASNKFRVTNCTFQANEGDPVSITKGHYGSADCVIINCVFQDNVIDYGYGGVVYVADSYVDIINCSFLNNTIYGRGLIAVTIRNFSSPVSMLNCAVFGNGGQAASGHNFYGGPTKIRYSLFDRALPSFNSDDTNVIVSESPFVSSTSVELTPCSPAVDSGDPNSTTATSGNTDRAGNPRIIRGTIDIGAYEYQGSVCPSLLYTLQNGRWDDKAIWSQGRLPTSSDVVYLKNLVTIPTSYLATTLQIKYKASSRLIYETGGRLRLGP